MHQATLQIKTAKIPILYTWPISGEQHMNQLILQGNNPPLRKSMQIMESNFDRLKYRLACEVNPKSYKLFKI